MTFPQDDAVLINPPQNITMSFRVDVRLLKLALYTDDGQWIDIGFRYEPERFTTGFVYPLGDLPMATYYVTRWAVADENGRLLSGEFRFAFGAGAIPPSETIAAQISDEEEVLPDTGSYRRTDL
ncbi:MAG: copper resistance protein CopC [Pseudohongiellaceae bacterium]